MNTLEQMAKDILDRIDRPHAGESDYRIILAALQKAVEPYSLNMSERQHLMEQNDKLREERDKLKAQLDLHLHEWAETDTAVRNMVKKVLPEDKVEGDSYEVPSIEAIVELLVQPLEQLQLHAPR